MKLIVSIIVLLTGFLFVENVSAMNKSELIQHVASETGVDVDTAGAMVDAFLNAITESLKAGEPVTLVGFGTFTIRDRAARTGINPQTGEPIQIAAARVLAFKPGKALKDAVND